MAIPQLSGVRSRLAVHRAADRFVAMHSLARSIAVRQGRVAELHIDAPAGVVWVQVDTTLHRTGTWETVGSVANLSEDGVAVASSRSLLCFDARGLATPIWSCPPGDAVLVFSRGGYADTLRTTVVGKVLR